MHGIYILRRLFNTQSSDRKQYKGVNFMKFNIIGRRYDIKDNVREYVEKKLSKLDKFFKDEPTARVVLGTIKDNDYIEAQVNASGMIYRAEVSDKEILAAIDRIVDIIERQIRKNKTRLAKKIRSTALDDTKLISGEPAPTEDEEKSEFEIVKTKKFALKPMTAEEAILQMKLLGHSFFVFKNVETEAMNVVYERKDGKYALIESID